jgi:hypothetical protein
MVEDLEPLAVRGVEKMLIVVVHVMNERNLMAFSSTE